MGCIFCDIVARSVPAYVIYEDEEHIAFLDKYPISVGHTLVLPKEHFERVNDMPRELFSKLYLRVHALNQIVTTRMGATASHISINDGKEANQLIPHVHVHIIPRSHQDNAGFSARKLIQAEQMEDVRKRLASEKLSFNP